VTGTQAWLTAKETLPDLVDDLRVHKPYIDEVTYDSPFAEGAHMRRVSEVIDCWFDSGAMPFAQFGWPHQNDEKFRDQFPADFISEALDQTRGWFYSLLAISTMLFSDKNTDLTLGSDDGNGDAKKIAPLDQDGPHPFRNCIVLGLMLGEDGQKMSKSKRNYREPTEIFDKYGADALRWFFFSGQAPWTAIRYREQSIRESIPEFLLRLWNVYSFFTIYAEIDGFDPTAGATPNEQLSGDTFKNATGYRPVARRSEIDRWIIGELHQTISVVTERMDALDNFGAAAAITSLVDGLSNWYVRRSRDRFWAGDKHDPDKLDAFWTLYEVLLDVSKLIAPFTPFLAETFWRELSKPFGNCPLGSVHLCDFPESDPAKIDTDLSASMRLLREIASLGRAARADANLKVRQPLSRVEVVLAGDSQIEWLKSHDALVRDELNVKQVDYTTSGDQYVEYQIVPNFKRLGPRVGKNMQLVKKLLGDADGGILLAMMQREGAVSIDIGGKPLELTSEDIEIRLSAREGWAAAQGGGCVVVLSTELTEALIGEGIAKDLIRSIQNLRKEIGCEYTDRIRVGIVSDSPHVNKAIEDNRSLLAGETLAREIVAQQLSGGGRFEGEDAVVTVVRLSE
jgi:isoleucyl-tRNA synthetase